MQPLTENKREDKTVTKRSHKTSIIGWLLVAVGVSVLSLSAIIFPAATEAEFATQMSFIVLALLVIISGYAVVFRHGHGEMETRKEAISALFEGVLSWVVFFVAGILIIVFVVAKLPMDQRGLPLFFSISLMIFGVIPLFAFALKGARAMARIPSAFHQIRVDKTFVTKRFTVFRKGDIYLLAQNKFVGAYFVRLFDQVPASGEKELRLPTQPAGFKWANVKDEILGLPVAKLRGDLTIPVDAVKRGNRIEEKYARGSGIIYVVLRYDMKHYNGKPPPLDIVSRFNETAILRIIEELSKESRQTAGMS